MGVWDAIALALFEDTAGNISRILGFSPEWAAQFKERYGAVAFTVAKYVRFALPVKPKDLGPLTKDSWRDAVWEAQDLEDNDHRFAGAGFKDMLAALKLNPHIASKLNGARDAESFAAALRAIVSDHKKKMTGRSFISFPDGWSWIGLGSGRCPDEGQMMQHCGTASHGGELFSLRDPSGNPHVTIEYHEGQNTIYQMRGKQNNRPDPKYGKYIAAFIEKTGARLGA